MAGGGHERPGHIPSNPVSARHDFTWQVVAAIHRVQRPASEGQGPWRPEKPHLCPHPEAVGTRWGDAISEDRQVDLRARSAWAAATNHGQRQGPFDVRDLDVYDDERMRLRLTGANVAWL
jgi:hypothetical protein